ncbi:hypothetical protein NL676_016786 [Syzygium grande]|nr:hypothetical protein NL676_016786 [Syzygium grande]
MFPMFIIDRVKLSKKALLIAAEAIDDGDCQCAGCRIQLLIGQKLFMEIGVVVVIEQVRSRGVKVGKDSCRSVDKVAKERSSTTGLRWDWGCHS